MGVLMESQTYKAAYVAAVEAATAQLDGLFEEAAQLRSRMEQINAAIDALKPLFSETDSASSQQMGTEMNPANQQVTAGVDLVLV